MHLEKRILVTGGAGFLGSHLCERLVVEMTGSRSRIVHRPLPQDDPRQRRPDISRADEKLGWAPRVPLREGLTRTIANFEELLRDDAVRQFVVDEQSAEA